LGSLDVLSKKDLVTLLEVAHGLCAVQNTAEMLQYYKKIGLLLLFDGCFALYIGEEELKKSQTPVFDYQAMNLAPEFVEKYMKKRAFNNCPISNRILKTWEAQNWKTTLSKAWNNQSRHSRSLCRVYGLVDGWSHGCRHLRQNALSFFSIAGSRVENNNRTRVILEYLVPYVSESLKRISHGELVGRKNTKRLHMTSREIEILKWLSRGKSTWEISVILSRSERVIFWHIDNLMKKLDAVNRTQAVAIAMQQQIIDGPEE
jgi:DNA-binding CsgD family transcriptional regulator